MRALILSLLLLAGPTAVLAQDYTSYRVGKPTDEQVLAKGGICMMGGGADVDSAMIWFLDLANGGDVLVLRTDGADEYNDYLFSNLGVTLNSVETIVCQNANASRDAYVQKRILEADAIWFADGNQLEYIDYWRNSPLDSLINSRLPGNKLAIGGSGAGMSILGRRYFSAKNGSVTSANALSNPFTAALTVDTNTFLKVKYLESTITDTHFDNPNRKGRAVVFLARNDFFAGFLKTPNVIALDERTAITVNSGGMARAWGASAGGNDNAYFIRPNCKNLRPEVMTAGTPLTWNTGGQALKVYRIEADPSGNSTFNLNMENIPIPLRSWLAGQDATGGAWEDWFVETGVLNETLNAIAPDCYPRGVGTVPGASKLQVFPNPASTSVLITGTAGRLQSGTLLNSSGQVLGSGTLEGGRLRFELAHLPAGLYLLRIVGSEGTSYEQLIKE